MTLNDLEHYNRGFLRILHLFAVGLHTCTAVACSLCVSWAFLLIIMNTVNAGLLFLNNSRNNTQVHTPTTDRDCWIPSLFCLHRRIDQL